MLKETVINIKVIDTGEDYEIIGTAEGNNGAMLHAISAIMESFAEDNDCSYADVLFSLAKIKAVKDYIDHETIEKWKEGEF